MELLPSAADAPVRIAHVGGRFLVFDVAAVARLRRRHDICAVLVGITPQAPNQGVFSGLPLELAPDEVCWLVRQGAAYVDATADSERVAHLAGLASPVARRRYLDGVARQHRAAVAAAEAETAERQRRAVEIRAARTTRPGRGSGRKAQDDDKTDRKKAVLRVTPTTSDGLVESSDLPESLLPSPSYALRAHLADRGYFATPGLRFGGDLSIYPGDPFRYHAHFVATSYGWDEPIALLDLVGTGRLATGVKKGLLIGGKDTTDKVRTFTLEWAAI